MTPNGSHPDTTRKPGKPSGRRHTFTMGASAQHYDHELLDLARVTRVVKGGRRFRFRASVIIGDRAGRVGFGIGKSKDVQQAIQKAQQQAAKRMVQVPLKTGTIIHTVKAKYKSAIVMLKPAPTGTGIIAGGTVRMVADLTGIRDLVAKVYGSSNRVNNAQATIKALSSIIKRKK
jgi:small subunit ribosomal protein S5